MLFVNSGLTISTYRCPWEKGILSQRVFTNKNSTYPSKDLPDEKRESSLSCLEGNNYFPSKVVEEEN